MYALAYRITRNVEDTEEIVQDVFVAVHDKISDFEGRSALGSWIHRITRNAAYMKIRGERRKREVALEDVFPEYALDGPVPSPRFVRNTAHETWDGGELRDALVRCIADLPEDYRNPFLLREIRELENGEIAALLNLSVPAVKSRLHRARAQLRRGLAGRFSVAP